VLTLNSRSPPPPPAPVVEIVLLPPMTSLPAPERRQAEQSAQENRRPVPSPRAAAAPSSADATAPNAPPGSGTSPVQVGSFFREFIPGCERETLILLPPAERERCNARAAVAQAARRKDFLDDPAPGLSPTIRISPDRMAEFNRASEAQRLRREQAGKAPMVACSGRTANFGVGCLP
jgi:hypothetical protein